MSARIGTRLVDGRGRSISTAPLYEVARAMRELPPGDVITLRVDPLPALDSDIPAWCRTTGHELAAVEEAGSTRQYTIRKAAEVRTQPAWAIVISNPGLEELLSPLGFALAAALAGSPVAVYFQGPAVRVLTRSFTERLAGWQRPFSAFARRGLARAGHPSPHQKLRQLDELGARIYSCGGVDGALQGDCPGVLPGWDPRCRLSDLRRGNEQRRGADLPPIGR